LMAPTAASPSKVRLKRATHFPCTSSRGNALFVTSLELTLLRGTWCGWRDPIQRVSIPTSKHFDSHFSITSTPSNVSWWMMGTLVKLRQG
jgi:hypothetical protein